MMNTTTHAEFTARGIRLHHPETITLDISPEQIAPGTEIFAGCRLSGARTSIGPDCQIGREAPVTLVDCQLGKSVRFCGGFAEDAVFLDGSAVGSGAHIRPGTLLEEAASCAHTVGLKQTLLMPYVTLGSLINFCDCLMAGGTGSKNHSEVGSSYIHFNFTAHQDKATATLIGDVPRGVMLDQPPIFLGGQGGLVGPVRIAYGSVLAAGTMCRRDVLNEGMLIFGQTGGRQKESPYQLKQYADIDRIGRNNFIYAGNLQALAAWYQYIRPLLTPGDPYAQACLRGAQRQLESGLSERCAQLEKLAAKIAAAPGTYASHGKLLALRPHLPRLLAPDTVSSPPESLVAACRLGTGKTYLETITSLASEIKQEGVAWLQRIVDNSQQHWENAKL